MSAALLHDVDWLTRLSRYDWPEIIAELNREGVALLENLLSPEEAVAMCEEAGHSKPERAGTLASLDRGRGEYRFFPPTLPEPWAALSAALYARLAPLANQWQAALGQQAPYPAHLVAWQRQCQSTDQGPALSRASIFQEEDYEALVQDLSGMPAFPLQATVLLSDPEQDFVGGELVMSEQRPRMQSRPIAMSLRQGDAAIFATHHRPVQGTRGVYRVNLKHGVSRILSGRRVAVDLIFHAAA